MEADAREIQAAEVGAPEQAGQLGDAREVEAAQVSEAEVEAGIEAGQLDALEDAAVELGGAAAVEQGDAGEVQAGEVPAREVEARQIQPQAPALGRARGRAPGGQAEVVQQVADEHAHRAGQLTPTHVPGEGGAQVHPVEGGAVEDRAAQVGARQVEAAEVDAREVQAREVKTSPLLDRAGPA